MSDTYEKDLYRALADLVECVEDDVPRDQMQKHLRRAFDDARGVLAEKELYESTWSKAGG